MGILRTEQMGILRERVREREIYRQRFEGF